ncbi:Cys-tRNA(Pro) deacylase [Suicoccus acidiformans]|uniref:Cys-tRNA(Pro)/Cys-tRNA(Cys) deacylase n=1 Tax=Suicoccus acidiformans TaxID=2036206 RepID=A0A347WHS5_9LACT|nr:aminoacyl-tRNA deacylase [Suicoccus acidiformans]AXY24632.1 Cys-tRNA(Pro) deacylase [Suicoccus acidiformans]
MAKKPAKTNVMRLLDQHKINYVPHEWVQSDEIQGSTTPIYKTLVTVGKSKDHYVFVVPVERSLDLKKAAEAVGEKNIHMIKEKELEPLTGYVHGGCSPIGMKKQFPTSIDASAKAHDTIIFSAGKVGVSVEVNPLELKELLDFQFYDVSTEE